MVEVLCEKMLPAMRQAIAAVPRLLASHLATDREKAEKLFEFILHAPIDNVTS